MDAAGIVLWIVIGLALGLLAAALLQILERATLVHDLVYVLPAALLGTFMGSEAFKEPWRLIGSEKGPEVGGFFIATGLIFGVVITFMAALAARAPAPAQGEPG